MRTMCGAGAEPTRGARELFLTYTDISEEQLAQIKATKSKAEQKQMLHICMQIDQTEGFRTEILKDFHFHNYAFCQSKGFTAEKTSTFLSIMKVLQEDTCLRRLTMDEAFGVFKGWLLKHSVQRPPFSVGVFTYEDVTAVTEFVHNTYFRHYKLWMYVYVTHRNIELCVRSDELVPPPELPARLLPQDEVDPREQPELRSVFEPAEAMTEEMYKQMEDQVPESKTDRVKRMLEERIGALMKDFEEKLKEQDERFMAHTQAA